MKIKRIFLDTSFFIRLLDQKDEHHAHAVAYFKRFREDGAAFILSTIAAAEYGVKDSIDNLPLRNTLLTPFNLSHARLSAALAKAAYDARRKGVLVLPKRVIIPNDTKLLAQAEVEKADLLIARDDNCEKVYRFLAENGLLSYSYLDVRIPPNEFFGELF